MSHSVDSDPAKAASWFVRLWTHLWFRLSCLIAVLVFELGFIWFILHFGWLESVNMWTQLGVILVAALPLLVAAAFLIRKRFSLTSALIAFTMFAVFMGFTMRPVYEARQARMPAKLLSDCGATVRYETSKIEMDSAAPRFEYHAAERIPLSEWKVRLIGDYADHRTEEEILAVGVESEEQLKVLAGFVDRLTKLNALHLRFQSSEGYANEEELIPNSGANQLALGNYARRTKLRTDLNWLANCPSVHSLFLLRISNDIKMILESDDLRLGGLHLSAVRPPPRIKWSEFVDAKQVRNLKMLSIQGYDISDSEAKLFSRLEYLRNFTLGSSSRAEINLLHHLPQLKIARIEVPLWTAKQLEEFEIPENLQELHLTVSSLLISESEAENFKASAPEGCDVYVTLR